MRIAAADLVPTEANLRSQHASFAELEAACEAFTVQVNVRKHRESAWVPDEALTEERVRLHVLPAAPHTAALGMTRIVNTDQTIRFGSVLYSTPPGLVGSEVWVLVAGTGAARGLIQALKRMLMPCLHAVAPEVLATAKAQHWDPTQALRVLLAEEACGRDQATKAARRNTAGLPAGKTLDSWREVDSNIQPRPRRPWSCWNGRIGPRT